MGEITEELSKPKNEIYFDEMNEADTLEGSAIVPRQRCYTSGDVIKNWDEMDETDKPEFTELSDDGIMAMFKDMLKTDENDELEVEPLGAEFDFSELYGVEYYAEKFPGFSDETYVIMARTHYERNELTA
jgi:hypothetical protein